MEQDNVRWLSENRIRYYFAKDDGMGIMTYHGLHIPSKEKFSRKIFVSGWLENLLKLINRWNQSNLGVYVYWI